VRGAFGRDARYWMTLFKLALPLGATLIVNFLYFRFDLLLLGWLREPSDVAIYGLAYKVIEAFIVIPSYFMITLFPEIARMEGDSERLRGVMNQALSAMEVLAIPILVLVVALARPIVVLIGGTEFEDAAVVLQILTVGLAVSFVNGVYGNALVALGRQAKLFWLSLLVLGANVAMNLVAIPLWGVQGAATAVSISEIIAFVVVRRLYAAAATLPHSARRGRVVIAGLAMAASLAWVPWAPLGDLPLVIVAGVVGTVVYGGALLALRALPEVVETELLTPLMRRIRRT
jgi:O-antigen/teichoic acid export membrane protein